jgi:ectoine hydroxylase-related dioxygenase (phytanoyl-CoA dioxygenase family)
MREEFAMTSSHSFELAVEHFSTELLARGYCLMPDLVPEPLVAALDSDLANDFTETPFCEGRFYGERTKRFGRLLARSSHAQALVQNDLVLAVVERILSPWCDCVQLNLTQAIAVHPGALAQMPHRDQDMWRGEPGRIEYLVNVMWPFTPYTKANGATRLWPDTHGRRALLPGPAEFELDALEQVPEYGPGSALLMLGSTLHAAGANRSGEVRRGMIAGYSLGWLKTYENQFLAYPPEVARFFPPRLAELVGYRQHRPNLGNFEGRCPSILFDPANPGRRLAAADALLPDQAEAVDVHALNQRRQLAA